MALQVSSSTPRDQANKLSDEVLLLVFDYLSPLELCGQVPLVCRRWWKLSNDTHVWDVLDLYQHGTITEKQVRHLVWLHPSTRKLILRNRYDLSDRSLVWCFFRLQKLTALDLSGCPQVGPQIVSAIAQHCKSLRDLNVNGCVNFDDECLLILTGCRDLRHLNFSECEEITDFGFNAVTTFLPSLDSVHCDGVMSLHDEVIETIVIKKCDTITDIQLDGANLTDEGVRMLSELHFLRRLRIQYCDELSDDAIQEFSNLKYLEELSLTRSHSLTQKGFLQAFSRPHHFMRTIEITECSGLDDTSLVTITKSCRNITSLDVSWCRNITDDGVVSALGFTPHLAALNVRCAQQLSDFVTVLHTFCPDLRYLNVISCSGIREEHLRQLSAELPDLEIAFNRDLGCSPRSFKILKYFDIMSPRQFAIRNNCTRHLNLRV